MDGPVSVWGQLKDREPVFALEAGADAVAIANSALQAIGCLAMRACHTDTSATFPRTTSRPGTVRWPLCPG